MAEDLITEVYFTPYGAWDRVVELAASGHHPKVTVYEVPNGLSLDWATLVIHGTLAEVFQPDQSTTHRRISLWVTVESDDETEPATKRLSTCPIGPVGIRGSDGDVTCVNYVLVIDDC